jgi:hypothetical protein
VIITFPSLPSPPLFSLPHNKIGQDLVAMCVNDILVQGAEPLFFLDYFATGKLNVKQATDVVKGIANACKGKKEGERGRGRKEGGEEGANLYFFWIILPRGN